MTYRIIGAAMHVHRTLGPGLLEKSYQEALAIEFGLRGIPFYREAPLQVMYNGLRLGAPRRADFLCFDKVVVEVKALASTDFPPLHLAQVLHYLRAARLHTGLLLNFGHTSLLFRRILLDDKGRM